MNIRIEVTQNKAYFEEFYQETLLYRLKYRKWQPFIAVLNLVIASVFFWKSAFIFSLLFMLFAIREAYDYRYSRKKWLAERMNSKTIEAIVKMVFTDEIIYHEGPYQKGTMKWETFEKIEVSPKGLFLSLQKGISIYLPKTSFDDLDSYERLIEKFKAIPELKMIQYK